MCSVIYIECPVVDFFRGDVHCCSDGEHASAMQQEIPLMKDSSAQMHLTSIMLHCLGMALVAQLLCIFEFESVSHNIQGYYYIPIHRRIKLRYVCVYIRYIYMLRFLFHGIDKRTAQDGRSLRLAAPPWPWATTVVRQVARARETEVSFIVTDWEAKVR